MQKLSHSKQTKGGDSPHKVKWNGTFRSFTLDLEAFNDTRILLTHLPEISLTALRSSSASQSPSLVVGLGYVLPSSLCLIRILPGKMWYFKDSHRMSHKAKVRNAIRFFPSPFSLFFFFLLYNDSPMRWESAV